MTHHTEHSKAHQLKSLISYAEGSIVSKIIHKNKGGNTTLFAFDKGQNLSEHTAPFDAVVVIIDGKCKITIDGRDHYLGEGEMIIMPANIPHALEASTAFKMLLIMMKE